MVRDSAVFGIVRKCRGRWGQGSDDHLAPDRAAAALIVFVPAIAAGLL
jgi:hypothetical protein